MQDGTSHHLVCQEAVWEKENVAVPSTEIFVFKTSKNEMTARTIKNRSVPSAFGTKNKKHMFFSFRENTSAKLPQASATVEKSRAEINFRIQLPQLFRAASAHMCFCMFGCSR